MSVLGKCKLCFLSASSSLFCCPGVRTLPWEIKHSSVVLGLKCHLSGICPLPKMTECCVHSRPGLSSRHCSPWLTGVRGPRSSSVWLQPQTLACAPGSCRWQAGSAEPARITETPPWAVGGQRGRLSRTRNKWPWLTPWDHSSSGALLTSAQVQFLL